MFNGFYFEGVDATFLMGFILKGLLSMFIGFYFGGVETLKMLLFRWG